MKIAIMFFYFGKLPNYFSLFLQSAGANRDVDFFFLTDGADTAELPPNVHKIVMPFKDVANRVQCCIDLPIKLYYPYKMCDFRPSFGLAFRDYFEGYDFWGYIDPDMILGQIRNFVTDDLMSRYDKIFTRGFATLYRNTDYINRLFLQKHKEALYTYQEAFRTDYTCHFDECGICQMADLMGVKTYPDIPLADIDYNRANFIRMFIQDEYRDQIWQYDAGKLFRLYVSGEEVKKQEMLLIHLQKRQMTIELDQAEPPKAFLIVPNRFIENQSVTASEITEFNRPRFYPEKYKIRYRTLKFKLKTGVLQQKLYRLKKKRQIKREMESAN